MTEKVESKNINLKSVLDGGILKANFFKRHSLVFLVLFLIAIFYIANGYHVYYIEQQNKRLDREIKQLRAEFVSTDRELINKMKYINIQEQIKERGLGLKELQKPAYTISANDN